jgi:hypothetical protein
MTDTRAADARLRPAELATNGSGGGTGFQPSGRRRNRIAVGVLLVAVAVGGNALVYATLDQAQPAVQVVEDVPAGTQLTAEMLRTVDVDADSTVNLIDGDDLGSLVGQYAKVRLVSGSLVVAESLQADPLVAPGSAIVAVQVPEGSLPTGLRERVPVVLVVPPPSGDGAPVTVEGRVVGLPRETTAALGLESVSVEVARPDAAVVAAADDVRVVLVEPAPDPAEVEDG